MSPEAHPPGWYVDPTDGSHYRWWDGRAWTEHLYPATPPPTRWGLIVTAIAAAVIVVFGVAIVAVMLLRAPVGGPIAQRSPIETPSEAPSEAPPTESLADDPAEGPASAAEVPSLAEIEGRPQVDGVSLSPADGSADGVDPAVAQPVPVVTGTDFSGSTVTVGGEGTPQLVVMVAGWCPSCQVQLPTIVEWMHDHPRDDVEVVVVVTWLDPDRPNWPPDDWLDRERFEGQVLVDDGHDSVSRAYGANATPFWVVIDRGGNLVERRAGQLDAAAIAALADAAVNASG